MKWGCKGPIGRIGKPLDDRGYLDIRVKDHHPYIEKALLDAPSEGAAGSGCTWEISAAGLSRFPNNRLRYLNVGKGGMGQWAKRN